jgi:aryl-alcohol dehydrogenase-like predicted oxidoreductase
VPFTAQADEQNFPKALKLVDEIATVGKAHNATPGQTTLAWLLAQGDHIIPIPGTKRVKYLEENTSALSVKLSTDDVTRIRDAINATDTLGNRYPVFFVQELYGDSPLL